MTSTNKSVQTQIQANNVLRYELETLKPGRNVYIQQQGSLIFFKSDKDTALRVCQETLKSLQRTNEHNDNKMDHSA